MFISKKWMIYYIFIIPVLLILFSNLFSLYFSPQRDEVVVNLGCRLVPCGDISEGCAAGEMCQVTCSLGDPNDDGVTNILDVILAVNIVLGGGFPNELQLCAADYNQDGILNILDVVALVNGVIGGSVNMINLDELSVSYNKPLKTYGLKNPLSKSYTFSISNVLSFFSLRTTGYECVESDFCQGSCFNGIDDDNDALEDEEDPSCSQEGVRDEPSPCKNFFDIETESEVFFANGDGSCLSEGSGGAHEVCIARGDNWVSINNFNTDPEFSNDQLCFDSDDFCCINTNAEGDPIWGNVYDTEGHVESELYGEVFYFVYCGDGYCQGWDHVNGLPVYRLLSWYGDDDIFLGEEFNSCIWRDEDNEIHSDCPIESFSCIVSESTDTIAQYLKPIGNFYLSSKTNAHVSLSPSYPYQVYCSYMNFELDSDEGFPLLRVYNSVDNSHVELMDQSDSNYETYNINTNGECFYVQEDSCPADETLQSFCVLAVSDVTNAHVEDCSLGNYDYKLCCGY